MPTQADSAVLALIEEAAILAESAEQDFVHLRDEIQKAIKTSRVLTAKAIVEEERARQNLYIARSCLSERIKRRDPRSVSACYCKGRLWVCRKHPAVALEDCRCGAAAVPCSCNPHREPPPGYLTRSGAWTSPRSIRWIRQHV
jgi:hypothetical protein